MMESSIREAIEFCALPLVELNEFCDLPLEETNDSVQEIHHEHQHVDEFTVPLRGQSSAPSQPPPPLVLTTATRRLGPLAEDQEEEERATKQQLTQRNDAPGQSESSSCSETSQMMAATTELDTSLCVESPPRAKNSDPVSARRVVLVTRPSERDMAQWKERMTNSVIKSTTPKLPTISVAGSAQSRNWFMEYKPLIRHSGWLIKRGHNIRNFKRRLFCIIDTQLVYHDSHDSTDVRGKIDLSKKSAVQCMLHSGFKLIQGSYELVLYASDTNDRDLWISKLQECGAELLPESKQTTRLVEDLSKDGKNQIIFSGWLRKRGQLIKSTKRRWFELTPTTLNYYAHPQGGSKKGSMEIVHASISNLDTLKTGERHSFVVSTQARNLVVHADSEEERSLWVASLSSVAEPTEESKSKVASVGRTCSCSTSNGSSGSGSSNGSTTAEGYCRRCASSFISKSEDAIVDVTHEVQLILASPYSPEGSTSAGFVREQLNNYYQINPQAVCKFMNGLADYMIQTRMNELRTLGGGSTQEEFTEKIIDVIYQQIEERVLYPLYRPVYEEITRKMRNESRLVRSKLAVLRSKPQSFFGINADSVSPSNWASACHCMAEIDKVSVTYMKRAQLLVACKEIYAIYHTEHPEKSPMNADEFIPAFIYVLVHSRLEDPVVLKEFITMFELGSSQGEIAYFVTCLEIALEYVRSLLIACTVVLDTTQRLGIEFAIESHLNVVLVKHLIPDGQASRVRTIHPGDVLVAVNGVKMFDKTLDELAKFITSLDCDYVEFCFLSMAEFQRRTRSASINRNGNELPL